MDIINECYFSLVSCGIFSYTRAHEYQYLSILLRKITNKQTNTLLYTFLILRTLHISSLHAQQLFNKLSCDHARTRGKKKTLIHRINSRPIDTLNIQRDVIKVVRCSENKQMLENRQLSVISQNVWFVFPRDYWFSLRIFIVSDFKMVKEKFII